MPINKSFPVGNGASPAYHVLSEIKITTVGAVAMINSYLAEPIGGTSPRINWQDAYPLDPEVESWGIATAEAWLISEDGPFAGGTLSPVATPVEQLRAELLSTAARRRKEKRKVYTHDFGGEVGEVPFDADEASAGNINAVLTAGIIASLPPEFAINYKCADDTYREFSLAQFQAMALGMLAFVQDLHTRESELIEEITAAGDDAEALTALVAVVKTFTRPAPPPEEEE